MSGIRRLVQEELSSKPQCSAMLEFMAPQSLGTGREHRHRYQEAVVGMVADLLAGAEAKRLSAVDAARGSAEDLAAAAASADGAVTAAEEKARVRRAERDAKESAYQESLAATAAAKAALEAQRLGAKEAEAEREGAAAKVQELARLLAEKFEPLKAAAFPGKQWRERDRLIHEVDEVLKSIGADASLQAALPLALRSKVEERGRFTHMVVDGADQFLRKRLSDLGELVNVAEAKAGKEAQAVGQAEAVVASAALHEDRCTDEFIAEENELMTLDIATKGAEKLARAARKSAEAGARAVLVAEEALAGVEALALSFAALRDGPPPAPPAEAEAAEAEEPVAAAPQPES